MRVKLKDAFNLQMGKHRLVLICPYGVAIISGFPSQISDQRKNTYLRPRNVSQMRAFHVAESRWFPREP